MILYESIRSTVRAQISPREVKLAWAALSSYFVLGLLEAACLDTDSVSSRFPLVFDNLKLSPHIIPPQDLCQSLSLIAYVLRTLVFLGIIIAMNFTVSHLKATLMHTPWGWNLPIQVRFHTIAMMDWHHH